jgi:hypothetical protein
MEHEKNKHKTNKATTIGNGDNKMDLLKPEMQPTQQQKVIRIITSEDI